jgi:hypothetical protein
MFLRAEKPFFFGKILKLFDADPVSNIRDRKSSDPGSGIQDGKNLDPGSGIRDGKNLDPGSKIRDKHPGSAKLEILSPNLLEPNNNRTLCGKGILGETKSVLQSKVASVALKRGKTPVNWIFQSPTRHGCYYRTTSPGAKPVLQLIFIRP